MGDMFSPLSEKLWNRTMAAHLLNRAGFGGTPTEIDSLMKKGPEEAVDSFLKPDDDSDLFPRPGIVEPSP